MDTNSKEYENDDREPCKYGINCYQKNTLHLSKYKHPQRRQVKENNVEPPAKKKKFDSIYDSNSNNANHTNEYASTSDNKEKDKLNEDKVISMEDCITDNELVGFHEKEFIKNKFLVDMPPDFYNFWNFCEKLNKSNPLMALNEVGLLLVGPFDVLAGKFKNTSLKSKEKYLLHWRYFYDPPEFQTVIKRNDASGYHLGYFRDSPDEMPAFLAYNFAKTDGTFTVVGDNLFAGVYSFLEFLKKNANPFMKTNLLKLSNLIKKEADNLKLNLSRTTSKITSRNRKTLAKTFNKLGFIVPYNKHTQLGYRPLSISNKELQDLLDKLDKLSGKDRDNLMVKLQEVLTNTNIAIDECDFGTGIELGLDILCSGVESLNSVASRLLETCYKLLNKEAFAIIIETHMKNRRQGFDLSII